MPKRSSTSSSSSQSGNRTSDNSSVVQEKNPAAVALGRLGGLKGGRARADKLSPRKRSQIAKKAALARWETHR